MGLDSLIQSPEEDLALVGECHTGIPMPTGTERVLLIWDMVIPTIAGAMVHSIDSHMGIQRTRISSVEGCGDSVGLIGILGGTNMKKC